MIDDTVQDIAVAANHVELTSRSADMESHLPGCRADFGRSTAVF